MKQHLGKTSWVSDGGAEQERHHGSLDCSRGTGSDISKVLQQVNKIRTKHFLWCNLFIIILNENKSV